MRRWDRYRLNLGKSPRREPDEIITRFVECARGKNGKHAVTLTLVGRFSEKQDHVVIGATCECEHISKQELDAITRLGGKTCTYVLDNTKKKFCLGKSVGHEGGTIDLGYGFSGRRNQAQGHRTSDTNGVFKPKPESQTQRWDRLYTMVARQAAGKGFSALRVERMTQEDKPLTSPDYGNWPKKDAELLMYFGDTQVAHRIGTNWSFDVVAMTKELEYSNGHKHCRDEKDARWCCVCNKEFRYFEPHLRKGRHIRKVIDGLMRAMFRLRKKKTNPLTRRHT
jgi:hypothetical protein